MSIFSFLHAFPKTLGGRRGERIAPLPLQRPGLRELASLPVAKLPLQVRESDVAMHYLRLLGDLDWPNFPIQADQRLCCEQPALPLSSFAAACLVKLDQRKVYMSNLRTYLVQNPALQWVLGFPLVAAPQYSWGFDPNALPTERHFCRLLREMPNTALQFLLDETVRLIRAELRSEVPNFGECVALDTKHIIAWVKENNPKAYLEEKRFDKHQQPGGDPDCKLGCKRKKNQGKGQAVAEGVTTPRTNPVPAGQVSLGEYYWGYGSGVVATKVDEWGEFVLAELTQPFDHADVSYFFPLMTVTERRLGFRPKYGALDAAYDAFYVYEYFHTAGGFAAVPLVEKGKTMHRRFDPQGLPLCAAGLAMPLKQVYRDRTTAIIEYERGQYACPFFFPQPTHQPCPCHDEHWAKGGCLTTIAISVGARIRHQLDRESAAYHDVYRQRTATERINSQAKELGIERPKLRNGDSIRNLNTLTYVLINLYALQRVRQRKAERLEGQKTV